MSFNFNHKLVFPAPVPSNYDESKVTRTNLRQTLQSTGKSWKEAYLRSQKRSVDNGEPKAGPGKEAKAKNSFDNFEETESRFNTTFQSFDAAVIDHKTRKQKSDENKLLSSFELVTYNPTNCVLSPQISFNFRSFKGRTPGPSMREETFNQIDLKKKSAEIQSGPRYTRKNFYLNFVKRYDETPKGETKKRVFKSQERKENNRASFRFGFMSPSPRRSTPTDKNERIRFNERLDELANVNSTIHVLEPFDENPFKLIEVGLF